MKTLTVAELIEALNNMPSEAKVTFVLTTEGMDIQCPVLYVSKPGDGPGSLVWLSDQE